jgi:hypothetical protein
MKAVRTIESIISIASELASLANTFRVMEERLKKGYLENRFDHVPPQYFPKFGTQAYLFLALLADGNPHGVWEILIWTGSTAGIRSALQLLTNPTETDHTGYFWLIINENAGTGKPARYRLSERHLSGCALDDAHARLEAERQYLQRRHKVARKGVKNAARVAEEIARFEQENPDIKVL